MEGDESFTRASFGGTATKRLRDDNRQLKVALEESSQRIHSLTNQAHQLLEENERLRHAVANGEPAPTSAPAPASVHLPLHVNADANAASALAPASDAELQRKNEMLSKQAELLMHELDEAHNVIRHRDQCLETYGMQTSDLERTIAGLTADRQAAEKSLFEHQEKVHAQKKTIEKLSLDFDGATLTAAKLEADSEAKSSQIKELEEERDTLLNKLENLSSRNADLHAMLEAKNKETDTIRSNFEENNTVLQATRKESAERSETIDKMEQDLSEANQKERIARKETEEVKQELDAALMSYDKVEAVCRLLKDQVETLNQERLVDTKSVEDMAQLVTSLKAQHATEISQQQECIDELTVGNANISSLNQRILREKDALEKQHQRQQRAQEEDRAKVKQTIQTLTDRISQSESKLDEQSKENKVLDQSQSDMAQRIQSLKEELEKERCNVLEQSERVNVTNKELRSLQHAYADERAKSERRMAQLTKDLEINRHQQRCGNADRETEIMSWHQRLEEEASKYQQLIQTKDQLYQDQEAKLSEEREVCHRLLERNREVNHDFNVLSTKNMELSQIREEQSEKLESLALALEETQSKLVDMGGELSRALEDQLEWKAKEKELRRELREVQAELEHVKKFGPATDDNE